MKVLFILFFVHLQDVFCDNSEHPRFFIPTFQNRPSKKNMQVFISRKFLNDKPVLLKTKKPGIQSNGYTVFPTVGSAEKKLFLAPDSPYFPHDAIEVKSRVKKVLPDYVVRTARRKRSAELKPTEDKQLNEKDAKKVDKVKDVKPSNKTRKTKKQRRSSLSKNNTLAQTGSKKSKDKVKSKRRVDLKNTKRPVKRSKKVKRSKSKHVPKQVEETRRLIAGKDATIEDYPYVVSIQKDGEHWCAGALLNPRLVITTANCIWKSNRASRLKVRAGSRHSEYGGQEARVQEVMKHPLWNIRSNPDNDIALLYLDRRIKFSHAVHGVDLPNRVMLPAFEDAWVTSFGSERRDGVYDKGMSLQVYHSRIMDHVKCNNVTQRFGVTVTDNFICLSQTGRRAPCTRDTGAPAVSDGVLWGLASWGIRKLCGTERFPAMFSYTASQTNMDFLLNATHYLMADERFYPYNDRIPTVSVQYTPMMYPALPI